MSPTTRDETLRRLLRAGDPLPTGERLSETVARAMRRDLLAAVPQPPRHHPWRLAFAAAALAAAATGAFMLSPRLPLPRGRFESAPVAATARLDADAASFDTASFVTTAGEPRDRQIQFVTRGGTRVIWMLKPRLDAAARSGR